MKPPRFMYHDPTTQSDVLALLHTYADDAKILAGGQSLVPLLNMRLAQPEHLIDINRVSDLAYIREVDGGLAIGALTRHHEVEHSPLVRQHCPLLAEAMPFIGHPPIRSRGTIGGSIAHADPTAELPTVLRALDGRVRALSTQGSRIIPAQDLFVSELQTVLTSQELLSEVWFPSAPPRSGAAFVEISRRHGDYALVGLATQLTVNQQGGIVAAQIALMGVGPTPLRAYAAEALLIGAHPTERLLDEAAQAATTELAPTSDIHASAEYRRSVAGVLVKRALQLAIERTQQGKKA